MAETSYIPKYVLPAELPVSTWYILAERAAGLVKELWLSMILCFLPNILSVVAFEASDILSVLTTAFI